MSGRGLLWSRLSVGFWPETRAQQKLSCVKASLKRFNEHGARVFFFTLASFNRDLANGLIFPPIQERRLLLQGAIIVYAW